MKKKLVLSNNKFFQICEVLHTTSLLESFSPFSAKFY